MPVIGHSNKKSEGPSHREKRDFVVSCGPTASALLKLFNIIGQHVEMLAASASNSERAGEAAGAVKVRQR